MLPRKLAHRCCVVDLELLEPRSGAWLPFWRGSKARMQRPHELAHQLNAVGAAASCARISRERIRHVDPLRSFLALAA